VVVVAAHRMVVAAVAARLLMLPQGAEVVHLMLPRVAGGAEHHTPQVVEAVVQRMLPAAVVAAHLPLLTPRFIRRLPALPPFIRRLPVDKLR
jgi:hypothetical protein